MDSSKLLSSKIRLRIELVNDSTEVGKLVAENNSILAYSFVFCLFIFYMLISFVFSIERDRIGIIISIKLTYLDLGTYCPLHFFLSRDNL